MATDRKISTPRRRVAVHRMCLPSAAHRSQRQRNSEQASPARTLPAVTDCSALDSRICQMGYRVPQSHARPENTHVSRSESTGKAMDFLCMPGRHER